ncbi:hypothetical protein [Virgibacillus halodenitrificans]|uniref:Uncharacterized protein n=1 Tax=Virgibacillus halodenitrificans TaxID=1482 RepID=A0ABR7VJ05_VIRHA|nr:hypothetical protein [Virgibacillus halodenitrificans]MBD1221904.1 hypothetical protein [Virgibacillus halodenitrificans]
MDYLGESKELAFSARNYSGKVNINYGINKEPIIWGFSELDLPFNVETAKGFPVCEANVSYIGKGYHSVFGWIQTIDMDIKDDNQQSSFVDVGALFKESDMPFFSFGNLPSLFDAPCIKGVRNMSWTAQAFLVTVGNVMMKKDVFYVIGFEWGYKIVDGIPHIKPIKELKMKDWNNKTDFLNKEYASWNFKKGNIAHLKK